MLTLWVLAAAALGYVVATWVGSPEMIEAGDAHPFYGAVILIKKAFIKMLFMLVAPVVFFSLVDGVIRVGDKSTMRALGGYTLAYYLVTSAIAISIGLLAVLVWHPWTRTIEFGAAAIPLAPAQVEDAATGDGASDATLSLRRVEPKKLIESGSDAPARILRSFLLNCFQNPFAALAEVNILAIVVQALLIGIAIVLVVPRDSPLIAVVAHITVVFHQILSWVIWCAPFGVFAVVFDFTLSMPPGIFEQLLNFCMLVFGATLLHGLVVLPLIAAVAGGTNPVRLFRRIARPLIVALSTSSSAATLPFTLQACEEELDVPKSVANLVCPLGATMNMDGTALFEGIAAIFLAWIYGIELGTAQIVAVFAMAMVSSIGAPGMPSGSMAGMQMVLLAVGIPLEAIAVLLVIERPLDTFRTAVNVEGDIVGALVVKRRMSRRAGMA